MQSKLSDTREFDGLLYIEADEEIYCLTGAQLDFLSLPRRSPLVTLKHFFSKPEVAPVMAEWAGRKFVCIYTGGELLTPARTLTNRSIRILGEIVPLEGFKTGTSHLS